MIISWGIFIRRSKSISTLCDLEDIHLKPVFNRLYLKPLNYLISFLKSLWIIHCRRKNVSVVILVSPPNVILYLIPIVKALYRIRVLIDAHNGTFSKKWLRLPFTRMLLKSSDLLIIHNRDFLNYLKTRSLVRPNKTKVVPDPPSLPLETSVSELETKPYFVFPASYADDEPIEELIRFFQSPDFQSMGFEIFLTGPSHKMRKNHYDLIQGLDGVYLTGFLNLQEYENLLSASTGALCLTTKEGIQLCAVNEAIGFGRIPIISNTDTLRSMYDGIGLMVSLDLSDLGAQLIYASTNIIELTKKVQVERENRLIDWVNNYKASFQ